MPFNIKLRDFATLTEDGAVTLHPHISAVIEAKGLPVKIAYELSKIGRHLVSELSLYASARIAMIKEFGEEVKDADGKGTGTWNVVDPEKATLFHAKHAELVEIETTVEVNPVKVSEFGDRVEGITPADLSTCHSFIAD